MPDQHPIVKQALKWCAALNASSDASFNTARKRFEAGAISYEDLKSALAHKGEVLSACLVITTEASNALLAAAESDLVAVDKATRVLSDAVDRVELVQDAVALLSELAVGAVALSVAVAAPSPASLAAAVAALAKPGKRIAEKVGD